MSQEIILLAAEWRQEKNCETNWSVCLQIWNEDWKMGTSWALQSLSCLAPFLNYWCSEEPGTCQNVNSAGDVCWEGGSPLPLYKTVQFLCEHRQITSLCWGSAVLSSCFPRLSVLQGADHRRTLWQGLVMQRSIETFPWLKGPKS